MRGVRGVEEEGEGGAEKKREVEQEVGVRRVEAVVREIAGR